LILKDEDAVEDLKVKTALNVAILVWINSSNEVTDSVVPDLWVTDPDPVNVIKAE